tara:strand:- start:95 stop:256 length:162 start_codon:yes stop_codon:yes gene_type:complete
MKKPNIKAICGKPRMGKKPSSRKYGKTNKASTSSRADKRKRASVYGKWAKGNL